MFSFATLYDAMPAQQGDGAEAKSPSAPAASVGPTASPCEHDCTQFYFEAQFKRSFFCE
jgi:hypothetical protein